MPDGSVIEFQLAEVIDAICVMSLTAAVVIIAGLAIKKVLKK